MLFKKSKGDTNAKQHSSDPNSQDSQDDNVVQLLSVTISAINVTRDLVPIALAQGVLGTIANILSIVQSVIKNKSDFLAIVKKCETIRDILERATGGTSESYLRGSFGRALSELNIAISRINSEVASKKEQSSWLRLFSVTIDRDLIAAWDKDLDRVLVLFNTETIAGMAIQLERLTLALDGGAQNVSVLKYRPTVPPSRPAIFYGRDDLVAELTDLIINDQHIALIGPGGMGKSSLAKAILNEPLVMKKFADRRFFVTYDGLDPSSITFGTFMTRVAETLGMELAGADPMRQISTFLRVSSSLIVLDNAETFEEASSSPTLEKIPPAIAEFASIPGVILILTSRSRRNAPDVAWVTMDVPPLDPNSAQDVFFRIYGDASRSRAEGEIKDLLEALEFHPLSISILANVAHQNGWSPAILLKRWDDRRSKLLDRGKGKLQSLSFTIQLSLSSPSIQDLGEDGLRALAVIAFLPQGLNDGLASDLLPSIPQTDTICDALCTQSLVYRQGSFLKMLAPIRHYVRDSLPPPDPMCLGDMHAFYYRAVQSSVERRDSFVDVVLSDHLNIEYVVGFNLTHVPYGEREACEFCWMFIYCLQCHLLRPTFLAPAILNVAETSVTWMPKAHCLRYLSNLNLGLSQLFEASKAFQAAERLFLTAGAHGDVARCVVARGDICKSQGRFIQSADILQDFQRSESWKYIHDATKAQVWLYLDIARMYTFTVSADELFVNSMRDRTYDMGSKIGHWRVKLFYGGDIVQARMHLEDLLMQCARPENFYYRGHAMRALAEAAYCEGDLSKVMDILHEIVQYYEERMFPESILWYTVWTAVIASDLGDYDLAREILRKSSGPLEFLTLPNARTFVHRTHSSAHVELLAGEYSKAKALFTAGIEGCDMQGDLRVKAYCVRGLGEVAFADSDFTSATQCFAEVRALCAEMGVPPHKLYSFSPFDGLPDRFEGWPLFLGGRAPFVVE